MLAISRVLGQDKYRFIKRQVWLVRKGGLSVLISRVVMLVLLPVWVLILLLVRALKPLIVIRFGKILALRIGHFALEPELYLCERDAEMHGQRTFDVFYYSPPVCNTQLKEMWNRILHVSSWVLPLYQLNRYLPGSQSHMVPLPEFNVDPHGLLERTAPHLLFTADEECLGGAALRELGIPDGRSFICFHARDSRYLDEAHQYKDNWRYHDYRDSNIHNYVPAAEELACRGYYTIRLGAIVKDALRTTNPHIIDYAKKARSDFMDIYLSAKCYFMLVSNTGPCALAWIFRRPIAFVNVAPFLEPPIERTGDLFIPKKYWLIEEKRFMTFKEILESGTGAFYYTEQYANCGIEPIENTSDEITALTVEMDERLRGKWQTTEEDEELQRRYRSLIESGRPFLESDRLDGVVPTKSMRIGTLWLRQNQILLEE